MIVLQTNHGDITIALNHEKAPISAANFEQYVRDGFYDGTLFHRVIDGFMVQGADSIRILSKNRLATPSKTKPTTG